MADNISIGTRGSELALWQAGHVKKLIEKIVPGTLIDIKVIKTAGDRMQDVPLSKIGDKGIFIKELETALLNGEIDMAVHSLKDMPTSLPEGLSISSILEREDPHDVLIVNRSKKHHSLKNFPQNAAVATGSLRRRCQLLNYRPDLQIVDIRGNLNTRRKKMDESGWDGMVIAHAGILRLGWSGYTMEILPREIMIPAAGQGALAIEIRNDNKYLSEILKKLHHPPTAHAVTAERSLLRHLEGGCQIPIGAYGRVTGNELELEAVVGSLDGKNVVRRKKTGNIGDAELIGAGLAGIMLENGGKEILEEIRNTNK